ncbi:MAG: DUF3164 family protein, partial [Alphaproteobacteria bacterium]|nr:DUF3164 family protein [Alphaproteobacteria bacterium]
MMAKDLLVHEQVYRMITYALGLRDELARFKAHVFADFDALDAMLAQDYGVTRRAGTKGNRSYVSGDRKFKVEIKINTPEVIGPELQMAKALIDEIVLEKGADADPVLAALVSQVFDVGVAGRVNVNMLRRLRDLELADPRWPSVRKAIGDAIKDGVSKAYITFHRWRDGAAGGWEMIPLDLAAVEITNDAFAVPSIRRRAEEAEAALAEAREQLVEQEGIFNAVLVTLKQFEAAPDLLAADRNMTLPELAQALLSKHLNPFEPTPDIVDQGAGI